jgi:hypothetical protein
MKYAIVTEEKKSPNGGSIINYHHFTTLKCGRIQELLSLGDSPFLCGGKSAAIG